VNYAPANVRAFVLPGMPADSTYTFSVQAYRKVDPDVAPDGVILSPVVTTSPYKPVEVPAFEGDIIGTIQGRGSLLVVQNLEAVASDSVLSTAEKPALVLSYNDAVSRYNVAYSASQGLNTIDAQRTAAHTAKVALDDYLAALSPAWNDASQHTPIVPAAFQSAWAAFYASLADLEAALLALSAGNSATVSIYQRGTSTPSLPSVTTGYDFTTGVLTGLNNGWSTTIPAGSDPIYISTAFVQDAQQTATIPINGWSAARIMAQNGEPGPPGNSGSAAKLLRLTASQQAVSYAASGTVTGGQIVTFTAARQNHTAAVTWSVTDIDGTARTPIGTYLTVASDGLSATMTGSQFEAARNSKTGVTVKITATDGGTVMNDFETIIKIQDGLVGSDGIAATLTNDAHQLPANELGNVSSYAGATGQFVIYAGLTDVSSNFTLSTPTGGNPQALTVTYTGRTYQVTSGLDANEDTATLTIRATGSGAYAGVTIDKVFSLSKAKQGATGSGTAGAPAVYIQATKKAVSLETYTNGTVVSFAEAFGQATVMSGTSDVTAAATLAVTATNCVGTINTAANTPVSGQPKGYYQVTSMAADNAYLTITATYLGVSYTETFSLVKSYVGFTIVAALPNTNNFDGRVVYRTTDGKLYRYVGTPGAGGAFTSATAAADVTGQIVSTQITDGAISTPKLAAGSVDTGKLAANAVTAAKIEAGAITSAALVSTQISALFATIGTLRTATTGARLELMDNVIKVYDASNVLRVQIGDLSL
jgi:hypothetical protein